MLNLVQPVHAAVNIGDNFWLGEGNGNVAMGTVSTISQWIFPLIKDAFVLAGVVLVLLLIFGGVTYIMNAGSGDKEGMEKGKNALTSAILGFIIIFAAYWIIQIISFVTGVKIFNSPL